MAVEDHAAELTKLIAEVRRIEVQSKRLVTEMLAGSYHSVFRGAGIEFDEVRQYIDGDDPRSVDWNVTARVGTPFVKKYVDERALTVLFLLDLSGSMSGGFGVWSARQVAARVVASLGLSAVRNNDRVGFVGFSDQVEKWVPPRKSTGHTLRIIRDCLALPATSVRTRLDPALEFAGNALPDGAIIFLISDFLCDGWRRSLVRCALRHDVVAIRLLPPELDPPEGGMMRLQDPETGVTSVVDWGHDADRAAYLANVAAWRARTQADLRHAQVDLVDVPLPRVFDSNVVVRPLLRFFHMRAWRGRRR